MIDPGDRRQARGDTGGEDRLIESQQIVCRNAGVQAQIPAPAGDRRDRSSQGAQLPGCLARQSAGWREGGDHLRANRRFVAQDIQVAEHLGMIDPGDRRQARGDTAAASASTPRCT
jgi:hypothetical protein